MSSADVTTKPRRKNIWLIVGGFLAVLMLGAALLFFVFRNNDVSPDTSRARSEQIIKKVGKLYLLPLNETPTVALIEDKESIDKKQRFYQSAKNGDYVLVYNKAKLALLYRESINKLVNVAPVTPTENDAKPSGESQ